MKTEKVKISCFSKRRRYKPVDNLPSLSLSLSSSDV